jgi:hypothetical protein
MREKYSKIQFISVVSDILSIVAFFLTFASASSYFLFKSVWLLCASIVLLGLLGVTVLKRKKISKKLMVYFMNLTAPDMLCEIVTKNIVYEYVSLTEMRFKNEIFVKPLHDGLDSFADKYRWTGSDPVAAEPLVTTHRIERMNSINGFERYKIIFGDKCYNKHDGPVKTGIQIGDMTDTNQTACPFLSTGVYDKTKKMTLQVCSNTYIIPMRNTTDASTRTRQKSSTGKRSSNGRLESRSSGENTLSTGNFAIDKTHAD